MQITQLRGLQLSVFKIVSIVYLLVYYAIPFGFHVLVLFKRHVSPFEMICFAMDH